MGWTEDRQTGGYFASSVPVPTGSPHALRVAAFHMRRDLQSKLKGGSSE